MRFKKIIAVTSCLFLFGCSKPNPNPELNDPIFADLNSELASINQQLESEKSQLLNHEKEAEEAPPQTGKIKFAMKRISESKVRIHQLTQEKAYLELKIDSRKRVARSTYLKAYSAKESWPNPREWELYSAEKKLRKAKKDWDVRQRMKEIELENQEMTNKGAKK